VQLLIKQVFNPFHGEEFTPATSLPLGHASLYPTGMDHVGRRTAQAVALDRNAALLRVERTHLTEELERQRETMSTLEQGQAAVASLKALREHMRDRLDSATPEDRRTVLEALETRVTVGVGGVLEVSIGIPQEVADCVHRTQGQ